MTYMGEWSRETDPPPWSTMAEQDEASRCRESEQAFPGSISTS